MVVDVQMSAQQQFAEIQSFIPECESGCVAGELIDSPNSECIFIGFAVKKGYNKNGSCTVFDGQWNWWANVVDSVALDV